MRKRELAARLRHSETAIWCGAGVSVGSGLPAARELVRFLLEGMRLPLSDVELLASAPLPFELTVQTLTPIISMKRLTGLFSVGIPNANHRLFAKLVGTGVVRTICTTNFDRLLEDALLAEDMKPWVDYDLYTSPEDLSRIDWSARRPRLFKLHGSVDDPESIIATLEGVAAREYSEEQARVIEHVFATGSHDHLLVLGYSFSDAFDVNPQIRALARVEKRITVVQHAVTRRMAADRGLEARLRDDLEIGDHLEVVAVDTDVLVGALWSQLFKTPAPVHGRAGWQHNAANIITRSDRARKLQVVSRMFELSGNLAHAKRYVMESLETAPSDRLVRARLLTDLGRLSNLVGDYGPAIAHGRVALSVTRAIGDVRGQAAVLGNLAIALHNVGDDETAIQYGLEAANLAREISAHRIEGNSYGNLGLAHRALGRNAIVARFHRRAIRIAQRINDRHGETRQLGNLGVCYRHLGRLAESRECQERALALARLLGDRQAEGVVLGDLGNVHRDLGDPEAGIRFYRKAYRLAVAVGNRKDQWNNLNNLAETSLELQRYSAASKHATRALSIAGDNPSRRAESLITLGRIVFAHGRESRALAHVDASLALTQALPRRHRLVSAAITLRQAILRASKQRESGAGRIDGTRRHESARSTVLA